MNANIHIIPKAEKQVYGLPDKLTKADLARLADELPHLLWIGPPGAFDAMMSAAFSALLSSHSQFLVSAAAVKLGVGKNAQDALILPLIKMREQCAPQFPPFKAG